MKRALQGVCATVVAVAAIVAVAPASAKDARCAIKTTDGAYSGPCGFTREKGGSFSLEPVGRPDFFKHAKDDPGITDISVEIEGSSADVRGLTTDGVNSRWGAARRSRKDRACWVGDDFSICVY